MAKKKGVRVTLLVEDETLERFARSVLLELGFHRNELRVLPYPVGQGSAKQWVQQNYPDEVRAHRSKAKHQKIALLVGMDADEQTVAHTQQQLDQTLKDAGLETRRDDERILLWIPKRNVETWIKHLSGEEADEDQDYKKSIKKPDFRAIAKAFIEEARKFSKDDTFETLPSLKVACQETERLDL